MEKRLKKAKTSDTQIESLTCTYILKFKQVCKVQLESVETSILYRAELWWKKQKIHEKELQTLINW